MKFKKSKLSEEHHAGSMVLLKGSLLFLSFLIAGCSTFGTPSAQGEFFPLPGSYEEVWQATLDTLKKEEISISISDSSKGHIQSSTFPLFRKEYRSWSKAPLLAPAGFCMLEVGVVKQTNQVTNVGIQAFFYRKSAFYFFGFRKKDKSRGIFEKLLIGRISDLLVKRKMPKLGHVVVGCNFRYDPAISRYRIVEVEPGRLADEQGLRNRDILLKIDGKSIDPGNLFQFFLDVDTEKVRTFTVKRQTSELEIPVSIFYVNPELKRIGVSLERDPASRKFKIIRIAKDSPAERAGLQVGDFLVEQNGILLDGWRNYYRAFVSGQEKPEQAFVIERAGIKYVRKIVRGEPQTLATNTPPT